MTTDQTFTMIKPDAVKNNHLGDIIKMICDAGFRIKAMKYTKLTIEQASQFYFIHRERPFFDSLIEFMSSGPIVAILLEKDDAVSSFRSFIGATNPAEAVEGSVRNLYGTSVQQNAVHGSDSNENAMIEADFFFSKVERY